MVMSVPQRAPRLHEDVGAATPAVPAAAHLVDLQLRPVQRRAALADGKAELDRLGQETGEPSDLDADAGDARGTNPRLHRRHHPPHQGQLVHGAQNTSWGTAVNSPPRL
jgi:hypothetical protein